MMGSSKSTIRITHLFDATPISLGEVGTQKILLGEPLGDESPLLMGVTHVRPGETSPLIQHDTAEIAYVLLGCGWIVTDICTHAFAPGDAILIDAGSWHAIRADDEPVEVLYVFPGPGVPPTRTRLQSRS